MQRAEHIAREGYERLNQKQKDVKKMAKDTLKVANKLSRDMERMEKEMRVMSKDMGQDFGRTFEAERVAREGAKEVAANMMKEMRKMQEEMAKLKRGWVTSEAMGSELSSLRKQGAEKDAELAWWRNKHKEAQEWKTTEEQRAGSKDAKRKAGDHLQSDNRPGKTRATHHREKGGQAGKGGMGGAQVGGRGQGGNYGREGGQFGGKGKGGRNQNEKDGRRFPGGRGGGRKDKVAEREGTKFHQKGCFAWFKEGKCEEWGCGYTHLDCDHGRSKWCPEFYPTGKCRDVECPMKHRRKIDFAPGQDRVWQNAKMKAQQSGGQKDTGEGVRRNEEEENQRKERAEKEKKNEDKKDEEKQEAAKQAKKESKTGKEGRAPKATGGHGEG